MPSVRSLNWGTFGGDADEFRNIAARLGAALDVAAGRGWGRDWLGRGRLGFQASGLAARGVSGAGDCGPFVRGFFC